MRDLDTNGYLTIEQNQIRPALDSSTPIHKIIRVWDLSKLQTILTVDSLKDDEERKKALYKKRRTRNSLIGAIAGGVIDAETGEDSILDGVLLGAAFGAVCTTSPDKPMAQVGLLFCDGSYIAAEVDKEEYTKLQTLAAANQKQYSPGIEAAFIDRNLTKNEVDAILIARSNYSLVWGVLSGLLIAIFPQFINFAFGFAKVDLNTIDSLKPFLNSLPYICIAMAVIAFMTGYMGSQKLINYVRGDSEKKYYLKIDK